MFEIKSKEVEYFYANQDHILNKITFLVFINLVYYHHPYHLILLFFQEIENKK
jgi:hypothetical protein